MEIFDPISGFHFNPFIIMGMGVFAGFFAGMVGLGGGLILVPLMIFYGVAPNVAAATANCFMVSTSSSGFYAYMGSGKVDLKIGIYLICGSFAGGVFGVLMVKASLESGQADDIIRVCFGVITGMIGLFMIWEVLRGKKGKSGRSEDEKKRPAQIPHPYLIVFCGAAAGLSSSVLGIAGGIFIVPFLIYFVALDTRTAVGTSLMHILFTTTGVSVLHSYQNRNLDFFLAIFLFLGAGAGTQLGVYLSKKISTKNIKLIFATLALAGSLRIWVSSFSESAERVSQLSEHSIVSTELAGLIQENPLGYGIVSVCIALGFGLFWGKIFKR